jgi:1-acyl-sn-glycerol-3-phosphate acyltransferase
MRRNFTWWLYQPYKWLVLIPLIFILSFLFGTLAIVLSYSINDKVGSRIGGQWWARVIAFLTPMLVSVRNSELMDRNQSYVIVANHLSTYDIFLMYGWIKNDFKWVMKKEVRKIPGVGFGSAAVGHIFIDRSDTKSAVASINKAKDKIKGGTSVVFFPEGTRSVNGQLRPFKKGAFRFALELGVPILPVTIRGTEKVLPAGTFDIFPGKAEMIVHKPIAVSNYTTDKMPELIDRVKKVIASELN